MEKKHSSNKQNYNPRGNCIAVYTYKIPPQQLTSAEVNSRPVCRALGNPTLDFLLTHQVYKTNALVITM